MHKLYILLFIISTSCGCNLIAIDTIKEVPKINGDLKNDVNLLLPEGEVNIEMMDGIKRDSRLSELSKQYRKGARENYEWYVDYIKNYKIGEPIPFHPNFGLTPEEYREMQERTEKLTFYSTGLTKLRIAKDNGTIKFNTDLKKLDAYNGVSINLNDNTAKLGDYTMEFVDTLSMNAKNGFKKAWKGYLWSYEDPKDIHLEALRDITGLNVIQYKLIIAQFEDGSTLISIKATEVQEGIIMIEYDIPLVI